MLHFIRFTLTNSLCLLAPQALQGTINTTQVSNGPTTDNNFVTPPRIDDAAEEVIQIQRLLAKIYNILTYKLYIFSHQSVHFGRMMNHKAC